MKYINLVFLQGKRLPHFILMNHDKRKTIKEITLYSQTIIQHKVII